MSASIGGKKTGSCRVRLGNAWGGGEKVSAGGDKRERRDKGKEK